MLTVAYCRVSTEEQASEGFSIDGQAERLAVYASLHELGEVTVVSDPGRSGKDLDRPGLQQLLAMVEAGHVAHVLIWRLDRLSRNIGDLVDLADRFGRRDVALHSFTERIDLSTATGRMFYNILASFAQFYREQLAENVKMGMHQAARQGKWTNRPKTGYDLVNGELVPNGDAGRVREIFRLRAAGASYPEIEARTGVKYSTVGSILRSRIYLGEVEFSGEWYPGHHEPLITEEEFQAAHRGFVPGRRRGRDVLSGFVVCGLCGKRMAVEQNGEGRVMYRCRHRGRGCDQPRRTSKGLHLAARLGLRLLAMDEELHEAIRTELRRTGRAVEPARRSGAAPAVRLEKLSDRRRKLLELYYADKISAEGFAEEEQRLMQAISAVREEAERDWEYTAEGEQLLRRFEEVAGLLRDLDLDSAWDDASDDERRVLVEELLERVTVFPDHLEVKVEGAPRLNVTLAEVGLGGRQSQIVGVGGPIRTRHPRSCSGPSWRWRGEQPGEGRHARCPSQRTVTPGSSATGNSGSPVTTRLGTRRDQPSSCVRSRTRSSSSMAVSSSPLWRPRSCSTERRGLGMRSPSRSSHTTFVLGGNPWRSRKDFGIVTCPFRLTVVIIGITPTPVVLPGACTGADGLRPVTTISQGSLKSPTGT